MKDDFDKQFTTTQNIVKYTFALSAVLSVVMLGFIGWVIVMVMRHFSIV